MEGLIDQIFWELLGQMILGIPPHLPGPATVRRLLGIRGGGEAAKS